MPTIFVKDSANSSYKKDFRSDIHKYEAACEGAFGATQKDKEEIRKNWNKKPNTWV
jgi:hypothetical protein